MAPPSRDPDPSEEGFGGRTDRADGGGGRADHEVGIDGGRCGEDRERAPAGVRPACRTDRPALAAIQAELDRPNPRILEALLGGAGTVLVSPRPDGTPAGYLAAVPAGEVVHVAELAVAPDRRREGHATAMLAALCARTDAGWVRLAVAPDNRPAIECYRSAGFRRVGRDPAYFDGEPAVIMARDLDARGPGSATRR